MVAPPPIRPTFWPDQVFGCFVFVKLAKLLNQLRKYFSYIFNNGLLQKYNEIGPVSPSSICPPPEAPQMKIIGIA